MLSMAPLRHLTATRRWMTPMNHPTGCCTDMIKQPMYAATVTDPAKDVKFPCYVSPKLDGVRFVVQDGVVLSKKMKPIPNLHVQKLFGKKKYNGFDGELIVGAPTGKDSAGLDVFNRTVSGVMTIEGKPLVWAHVFDITAPTVYEDDPGYIARLAEIKRRFARDGLQMRSCVMVPQYRVSDLSALLARKEQFIEVGYEGIMGRALDGLYKEGSSTLREGRVLKL